MRSASKKFTLICFLLFFTNSVYSQQQYQQYRQEEISERVQEQLEIEDGKKLPQEPLKMEVEEKEKLKSDESGLIQSPDYQKTIAQVSKAVRLINTGEYEAARNELVAYLADSRAWYASTKTTQSQVLYLLGFVNFQLKSYPEAEQFLKLQIEFIGVRDPETLNLLGLINRGRKEYVDAEYYLKESIRRAQPSQKPRYQYNLGNTYLDQGKYQEAYDVLKQSYENYDFWKVQSMPERVQLIYSYGIASQGLGKNEEAKSLFQTIEGSEYLSENARTAIAKILGKKVTEKKAGVKKWSFLLRPTALYDTNVQFLPSSGPGAATIDEETMAYTILFAPTYQEQLTEKVTFQFTDFVYWIYHQERVLKTTDLLNNSTVFKFLVPIANKKYSQRFDSEFRIDLPIFNTEGYKLFYQQYTFTPSWVVYWRDRASSRFYGRVQGIQFREDNFFRQDRLSGVDLYAGLDNTFLLGKDNWKFGVGYEYHRAQRVGSNFIANYNQIFTSLLSPNFFHDKMQFFFRGKGQFGFYPQFSPNPKRKEFTLDLLWNIFYTIGPQLSIYTSINWMRNLSNEQPAFSYNKQIYEGGLTFLF